MKHISLFSGIGGFNLSCEWLGIPTILSCEIDPFCRKVLKKHWPGVEIVEDVNNVEEIKSLVTKSEQQTGGDRQLLQATTYTEGGQSREQTESQGWQDISRGDSLILTAGFPCQPFSQAGRRKGKDDHRYLWPQTLAVIEAVRPDWCLLENVAGILSMVFPDSETPVASQATLFEGANDEIAEYDTICGGIERDLRQAGYDTVWLLIPACSVGAPHRRDRVWIVANTIESGARNNQREATDEGWATSGSGASGIRQTHRKVGTGGLDSADSDASDTSTEGLQGSESSQPIRLLGQCDRSGSDQRPDWQENWYEVATRFCRVDARVSDRVDRLKALGNAIVPQVAYEIIKAIQSVGV
jgi:DNA (cytosine-5)-methyltransferase 1